MMRGMGPQAAWVLVGLALDCAALLAVLGAVPPPGRPELSLGLDLVRSIAVGAVLTLTHGVVLPVLVWPGQRLTRRFAGWAVLATCVSAPTLYLAFVVAVWVGGALLWAGAAAGLPGGFAGPLAVLGSHASAGATAFAAMALLNRQADGCVRLNHSAWGGAAAGAVLGGVAAIEFGHHQAVLKGVPAELAAWPLPPAWTAWLVLLSAGLPHLLLSARHLPPTMAPLPVALRRAAVVAAVVAASGLALQVA